MTEPAAAATDEMLEFFKGLANENRQRILFTVFCDKRQHTVGEVAARVGIAPSTASEHLAVLKRAGVLLSEKKEKEVYYAVNKKKVQSYVGMIRNWLTCC